MRSLQTRGQVLRERGRRSPSANEEHGFGRIALLDELNVDAEIGMGHLILIGRGVGDCLEVAAGRDNEVNVPILSMVARAALETGGQLGWLLDDSIDGTTRARRFPTWRFADLRTQRLLVTDFRPQKDEGAAVAAELDEVEHELHAAATAAGWLSKPTVVRGEHLEAAALLDSGGKNERVPQSGEPRDSFPARRACTGLLSIPAHGVRFGMRHNMQVEDQPDDEGKHRVRVGGFGAPPNLAIGLSVAAVDRAGRLLAGWDGVDAQRLYSAARETTHRAGIG
jgi:hypothetical protein